MKHHFCHILCLYGLSFCLGPAQPANAQVATPAQESLPPGVDQMYALQGSNTILAYATPDGYLRLRSLVKHLDGDLDIIRTETAVVEIEPAALTEQKIDRSDVQLLAAFRAGKLMPLDRVRMTAREDTPIDAQLRVSGSGTQPLLLVAREENQGGLSLELLQPLKRLVALRDGETAVVHLESTPGGRLRLLFLTPTRVSSRQPAR